MNMHGPMKHWLPFLNNTTHKILFKDRALGSNFLRTKRRLSTSHLPILEPMLRPALLNHTIYSISLPPSHPRHFMGLPRASRGSAIHVFLLRLVIVEKNCLVW